MAATEKDVAPVPEPSHIEVVRTVTGGTAATGAADAEKKEAVYEDEVIMKSPFDDLGAWQTARMFKYATFVALVAAFSACAEGFQIGMTGNIISNAGFIKQYGSAYNAKGQLILAADRVAAWGGVQSAGQGLGMITMHFVADRYGRKISFFGLWVVLIGGVCCESFGRTWQTWLVAKLFSGYAVGSVQFLTGSYVAEISPPRIRGFLLIFYSIWYSIGQFFCTLALKLLKDKDPLVYLPLIYSEWAVIGIMGLVYWYIPESMYWCATHGHHERGRAVLARLNGRIPGYDVDYHYSIVRRTVELEARAAHEIQGGEKKSFWQDVWDTREIFKGVNGFRTLVAFMPAAVQQLTGLQVLSAYSSYFAQLAAFADPFVFTMLLSVVAILITIVAAVLVDFIGRRTLFLWSVSIVWCNLLIIGGIGLMPTPRTSAINKLTVFFSLVWRMASTVLGDLGWSYVAETGNMRLRAKTAGFSAAGGVCFGLIFSTTVPYMINQNNANWGLKTAFFFAGVGLPMCAASFFVMPDTSRRTAAELDEMFEKKVKPWRFRSYVTDAQLALEAERERVGTRDVAAVAAAAKESQQ